MRYLYGLPAIAVAALLAMPLPALADINQGFAALQQSQFDEARAIFTSEAEAGNVIGEFMLGVMAEQGFGQPKDPEQAVSWFKHAADKGMASAAFNLARFYEHGDGVPQDVQKAHDYLLQAAEAGHGKAMHNLGRLHESDVLGGPDYAEALKWYSAAATHLKNADRAVAVTSIDALHRLMTGEQVKDGDARYTAWIADHPPKK